jgi:hypothetical protein
MRVLSVSDQTRATTHPRNVHPKHRLTMAIGATLLCLRSIATAAGTKYITAIKGKSRKNKKKKIARPFRVAVGNRG